MISMLSGFPEQVVAASANGWVTKADYDKELIPAVEDAFAHHTDIRCYYELGPGFEGMDTGAIWEDFMLGVRHLKHWERVAVVTDVKWIRGMANAFRFLMPGKLKTFDNGHADEAKAWITNE